MLVQDYNLVFLLAQPTFQLKRFPAIVMALSGFCHDFKQQFGLEGFVCRRSHGTLNNYRPGYLSFRTPDVVSFLGIQTGKC
ncbi:hypothetical protein Plhal304r1_c083g0167841 [Plasmopara halstedii]